MKVKNMIEVLARKTNADLCYRAFMVREWSNKITVFYKELCPEPNDDFERIIICEQKGYKFSVSAFWQNENSSSMARIPLPIFENQHNKVEVHYSGLQALLEQAFKDIREAQLSDAQRAELWS